MGIPFYLKVGKKRIIPKLGESQRSGLGKGYDYFRGKAFLPGRFSLGEIKLMVPSGFSPFKAWRM
jgi:hypothetical protein